MVAIEWLNYTYTTVNLKERLTISSWSSIFAALIARPFRYCFEDGWCYGFNTIDANVTMIHGQ